MRLWSTSQGLDAAGLVPGEDLVLDLEPVHGDTAPDGVSALDHLGMAERQQVDASARELLGLWRAQVDVPLTRDGIQWGWIWELELHNLLCPALAHALGLKRAVESHGTRALQLGHHDPRTRSIGTAVARATGIAVEGPAGTARPAPRPAGPPARGGAGRRLTAALTTLGFPTFLRDGAIVVLPYWPLLPVLDSMFARPGWRPAVWLGKRPARAVRTLRSIVRGGWVGLPTPLDRRRSAGAARELAEAVAAPVSLVADGIDLGPVVAPLFAQLAAARARGDLAHARQWDRALSRGRARRLVCANDIEPLPRILVALARRHGVPTLAVQHGAFLIPQPVSDLDAVDEVVLWSRAVAPPMTNMDGPVHSLGYPLPHAPEPYRRYGGRPGGPVTLVLGQVGDVSTATLDKRLTVRSYQAAAEAFLRVFGEGRVILRPHPSEGQAPAALVAGRLGERVSIDRSPDLAGLMARADLCVGGTSAATLQAAVEGVPTAVLNLSGLEWPWPIGGDTEAPVARSQSELVAVLERFAAHGTLPGQEHLLEGLGADGRDAAAGVLELLEADQRPRAARSARPASERS